MDILTRVSLQGSLKCERHCDKVQKAFSRFCTVNCKEKYLKTFSSVKRKALPHRKKPPILSQVVLLALLSLLICKWDFP